MTTDWHAYGFGMVHYRETKGFIKTSWANVPVKMMHVVSELEEFVHACEGARESTPALHSELVEGANTALIELVDAFNLMCADLTNLVGDAWCANRIAHTLVEKPAPSFLRPQQDVWPVLQRITVAFGHWRLGEFKDVQYCIELAMRDVVRLFAHTASFVEPMYHKRPVKTLFELYCAEVAGRNASRPHQHGKTMGV